MPKRHTGDSTAKRIPEVSVGDSIQEIAWISYDAANMLSAIRWLNVPNNIFWTYTEVSHTWWTFP